MTPRYAAWLAILDARDAAVVAVAQAVVASAALYAAIAWMETHAQYDILRRWFGFCRRSAPYFVAGCYLVLAAVAVQSVVSDAAAGR